MHLLGLKFHKAETDLCPSEMLVLLYTIVGTLVSSNFCYYKSLFSPQKADLYTTCVKDKYMHRAGQAILTRLQSNPYIHIGGLKATRSKLKRHTVAVSIRV